MQKVVCRIELLRVCKLYINYVNEQENKLNETEKLKEDFHNEFFKDNKDKNEKILYTPA